MDNKYQTNLTKGDVYRMQKISCGSPSIMFARWQHASRSWSCEMHLGPHIWETGRS